MTAKKPHRTVVPPPAVETVIPHYIDVPPELEAPAEAVRAAVVRERRASAAVNVAQRAFAAADNADRLAAAQAGPDNLPEPSKPRLARELQEARAVAAAAQDAVTLAVRAQSAAIAPVRAEWGERHEAQVRERVQRADEQLAALIDTFAEIQTDVCLDDALREYDPRARSGWRLNYRTTDVLLRQVDKAERRLRQLGFARDVIPNALHELLAAVRVQASMWEAKRERERQLALRDEIVAQVQADVDAGTVPRHKADAVVQQRIRDANVTNAQLPRAA